MQERVPLTPFVETYRFWDVVAFWARERLEHEEVVARVLAGGVVLDGLRLQSVASKWVKATDARMEFKGSPYVGFRATPDAPMCVLRADALAHLLAVVRKAESPSRELLAEEFITREDVRAWAIDKNLVLPHFWFGTILTHGLEHSRQWRPSRLDRLQPAALAGVRLDFGG